MTKVQPIVEINGRTWRRPGSQVGWLTDEIPDTPGLKDASSPTQVGPRLPTTLFASSDSAAAGAAAASDEPNGRHGGLPVRREIQVDELPDEASVRLCHGTARPHQCPSIAKPHAFMHDEVGQHDGDRAAGPGPAMHQTAAAGALRLLDEVECDRQVRNQPFSWNVFHAHLLVPCRIRREGQALATVQNMADVERLQRLRVRGPGGTAQEKPVEHLRDLIDLRATI
mmetsp:Transcript_16039/g.55780  ORF Transcript_16039/g.55780 Transcript_16039/m.55780 type:complete len:226 (-) Transcript_16039:612-1289(-)